MGKIIEKIIQSKYSPNSTNVLWDDGENLKIARNGIFENVVSTTKNTDGLNIEVTVDNTTGTPNVNTTIEDDIIKLAFSGLKGEIGPQGNSGYQGIEGELEVVNNLIDGGESAALSAEQGKVLKNKLAELSEEIDKVDTEIASSINIVIDNDKEVKWHPTSIYVSKGGKYRITCIKGRSAGQRVMSGTTMLEEIGTNIIEGTSAEITFGESGILHLMTVPIGVNEFEITSLDGLGHRVAEVENYNEELSNKIDEQKVVNENRMITLSERLSKPMQEISIPSISENGKIIHADGSIHDFSSYWITEPISVNKGQIVRSTQYTGSTRCAIARVLENGNYLPLSISDETTLIDHIYVVEQDMNVVFCGSSATWALYVGELYSINDVIGSIEQEVLSKEVYYAFQDSGATQAITTDFMIYADKEYRISVLKGRFAGAWVKGFQSETDDTNMVQGSSHTYTFSNNGFLVLLMVTGSELEIEIEVVGSLSNHLSKVIPPINIDNFEIGNITIVDGASDFNYNNFASPYRARTRKDAPIYLVKDTVLKSARKFYIGWKINGVVHSPMNWLTEYIVPHSGEYTILIENQVPNVELSEIVNSMSADRHGMLLTPEGLVTLNGYGLTKGIYQNISIDEANQLKKPLKSIAHRGCTADGVPDSSKWSIINSAKYEFDAVEFDIQWTSDNIPVVCHQPNINEFGRYPDGSVITENINISDITFEQVQQYDFGLYAGEKWAGTKMMKLADALVLAKKLNLHVYAEVKTTIVGEKTEILYNVIKDSGMLPYITIITMNASNIYPLQKMYPLLRVAYQPWYIEGSDAEQLDKVNYYIEQAKSLKNATNEVIIFAAITEDKWVDYYKNAGLPVEVWGADGYINSGIEFNSHISGVCADKVNANTQFRDSLINELVTK